MQGTLTPSLPATLNFRPKSVFPRRPSRLSATAAVRTFSESTATFDREKSGACTSLYEVLRIRRNATPTEIKTAYRSLAKMYHPDLSGPGGSDGRDFMEIHNAYETLSDPAARAMYDLSIGVGIGPDIGRARSGFGFYPSRRWETDQCW
ncbi:DnaJ domain-containing protein [Cephalotus follicularis]|uniref:DnaJ domain-containing protein n=1 Tax=Cephalotus follicularis TaxID=3775 RepID=A0A1Q3C3J5_CEPFO|nr:DnaJ domain-containing protein [Cephalotus follicularis]